MANVGKANNHEIPNPTDSLHLILTKTMTKAFTQVSTPTSTSITDNTMAPIGIKLDGSNYLTWS